MRRASVVVFTIFAIALILWAGWDNLRARKLGGSLRVNTAVDSGTAAKSILRFEYRRPIR